MHRLNKKYYFIALILIFILIVIVALMLRPFRSKLIEESVIHAFNETPAFAADNQTIDPNRFQSFITDLNGDEVPWKITVSDFNLANPKFTLVIDFDTFANVYVLEFRRGSIFEQRWEYVDHTSATARQLDFEDVIKIARKYDLTKENPDPENITIFEPIELPEPTEADIRYDLCIEKIGSGEITTQEELLECNDLNNPID
jgi:hypothetical protein